MSLFGGDSSALPTDCESEIDSEFEASVRSPTHGLQAPSAQLVQDLEDPETTESGDALTTESEEDLSDAAIPTRPNRFTGKPQTWKGYTAAERQVTASLDQIRDTDLAAHLYNAHALRRRIRRPENETSALKSWQSRDHWLKSGVDLQYEDAAGMIQTNLVPPKDWTAWPLPPRRLPGNGSAVQSQPHDDIADWIIDGSSTQAPGENLREEILAVFLRLAKQQWHSRQPRERSTQNKDYEHPPRSRSRSKSVQSAASRDHGTGTEMDEEDQDNSSEPQEGVGTKPEKHTSCRQGSRKLKSAPLADDTRAQRLLQPSIHSMLANVDDLALALRRTRANHFGRGGWSDASSQSEFTSDAESTTARSRPSSRALQSRPSSRLQNAATSSPKKSARVGKRPVNSDDQHSTANPPTSSASESERSKPHVTLKRARSGSTQSEGSASVPRDWSARTGLMDWSEVLTIAATKGWNEKALARTAERCAALFGESMSFAPLTEHRASDTVPKSIVFAPATVQASTLLSLTESSADKRPFFQVGTLRCPHVECYGSKKDFALPYRTVEHCIRVHGYDPRTNDSDNEERTVGGVHIDGFLQPVTLKPGWLGYGRTKAGGGVSKKQKMKKEVNHGDFTDAVADLKDPGHVSF